MAKLRYANSDLGELALQLALSPRHLRQRQLEGIDRLLDMVVPAKSYPYDLICFHITGTRTLKQNDRPAAAASQLLADLPAMAEQITRRAAIPVGDLKGKHKTLDALSSELEVSSKTIRRWRSRGLLGIRAMGDDGVSRLMFPAKAVERFCKQNRELVQRGASFTLLSEAEKTSMVEMARAMLSEKRCKLLVVARVVAAKSGRAVETVRYTLRQYDAAHPDNALFARNGEPVVSQGHLAIWRCNQKGESAEQIAEAFDTDAASIEAVLRELEARQLKSEPWDYVDNELFHAPNARELILEVPRPAVGESVSRRVRAPRALPGYLRALYDIQLLDRRQEGDLSRRYNYLRFCVARAVEALDVYNVTREQLDQIKAWRDQGEQIKNEIIQANLRLVVSVAKRHVGRTGDIFEIISDGNMTLMRAVEKFDFALGNKFSTYAMWSVMKNYARTVPERHYRLRRFVTGQEELLDATADHRPRERSQGDLESVRSALSAGMQQLTERERTIVKGHFGLFDRGGKASTLAELGKRLGVTKERVRQIEQLAINKLREVVSPSLLDAFAD
ncbi:MAG: sigma-70 family RNA polymerase sigma factor [Phycisphaerae bacterium]